MSTTTQPAASKSRPSRSLPPQRPLSPAQQTAIHAAQNPHLYKWPKGDLQIPLLSKTTIGVTAFLGGAFAGGLMIAINLWRREGKKAAPAAIGAVLLGVVGSAATVASVTLLPFLMFLTLPIYLGIGALAASIAGSVFEADYATRQQAGIKPMSFVIALPAIVAGLVLNVAIGLSVIALAA